MKGRDNNGANSISPKLHNEIPKRKYSKEVFFPKTNKQKISTRSLEPRILEMGSSSAIAAAVSGSVSWLFTGTSKEELCRRKIQFFFKKKKSPFPSLQSWNIQSGEKFVECLVGLQQPLQEHLPEALDLERWLYGLSSKYFLTLNFSVWQNNVDPSLKIYPVRSDSRFQK